MKCECITQGIKIVNGRLERIGGPIHMELCKFCIEKGKPLIIKDCTCSGDPNEQWHTYSCPASNSKRPFED